MRTLHFDPHTWRDLRAYLQHPVIERLAFLAAIPAGGNAEVDAAEQWRVVDVMYLDDETDYADQASYGMELADHMRPRSLQWAKARDAALIEIHSHGRGRTAATFSNRDLRSLAEGAPVLAWRLRGRPYGALVVGGPDDFDGLSWASRTAPARAIEQIAVDGRILRATGRASQLLHDLQRGTGGKDRDAVTAVGTSQPKSPARSDGDTA